MQGKVTVSNYFNRFNEFGNYWINLGFNNDFENIYKCEHNQYFDYYSSTYASGSIYSEKN